MSVKHGDKYILLDNVQPQIFNILDDSESFSLERFTALFTELSRSEHITKQDVEREIRSAILALIDAVSDDYKQDIYSMIEFGYDAQESVNLSLKSFNH